MPINGSMGLETVSARWKWEEGRDTLEAAKKTHGGVVDSSSQRRHKKLSSVRLGRVVGMRQ